ncbi:MAG: DUF4139 domain-containing protein [Planctomycetes bacterium]|nr:DUF4139 domain-containing protein [Planctomycetota bacterium]
MKIKLITVITFAASLVSTLNAQQFLHVESNIDRVTIYPGYALVERVVEIPAQAQTGDFVVVISPLPLASQVSSFQTQVSGNALSITGVELRSRMSTSANMAKATELGEKLAQLNQLLIDAKAVKAGIKLQISALINMSDYENQSTAATSGLPDGANERLEYLGAQMSKFDVARQQNQARIDLLADEISDVELQIYGAQRESGKRIREARIKCYAQELTSSTLRLSYLVSKVNWQPAYDVRINPDLTGVNVNFMGEVSQNSGEDWNGVQLALSTSTPSVGLDPPSVVRRSVSVEQNGELLALGYAGSDSSTSRDDNFISPPASIAAPSVKVTDFGITTQYILPGKIDVASNGEAHRFAVRTIPLEVTPERYVVPSQSDNAYLRAEVTHTGDSVLLAGRAKIFLGPDFLGESSFPLLRQGDATTLNLGIDPNLEIVFETVKDYRDDPGSFSLSSTSTITRRYRAALRLSPAAHGKITVVVEDALPTSDSDEVEVEIGEISPAAVATEDALRDRQEKGLYRWTFLLHPGESKAVRWGYELSFDDELSPRVRER